MTETAEAAEPVAWQDIAQTLCGIDGNGFLCDCSTTQREAYEIRAKAVTALYTHSALDAASAKDGDLNSLRVQLAQSEANHGQAVSYLQDQLASAEALAKLNQTQLDCVLASGEAWKRRAEKAEAQIASAKKALEASEAAHAALHGRLGYTEYERLETVATELRQAFLTQTDETSKS